jgi:hypothetical protein
LQICNLSFHFVATAECALTALLNDLLSSIRKIVWKQFVPKSHGLNFRQATALIKTVCDAAGSNDFIEEARAGLTQAGVIRAVQKHNDAVVFDWLMEAVSYQGVSDAVAAGYMDAHGTASADQIARDLDARPACDKLHSYWQFSDCGYRKTRGSCNRTDLIGDCPLPRLDLRNGSLNQAAYSLYMFMRDIAGGDFVAWIDSRLAQAEVQGLSGADAVIEPLAHVHGLSFKVLSMGMSALLLAGDPKRAAWNAAGAHMIAIDSLVHAWLHRTGILRGLDEEHAYGPACYGPGGCAAIIEAVAMKIDARAYNSDYPRVFPRFVQHAIWRFCAQQGFDQCNGNRINDSRRCYQSDCMLFDDCARLKLGRNTTATAEA